MHFFLFFALFLDEACLKRVDVRREVRDMRKDAVNCIQCDICPFGGILGKYVGCVSRFRSSLGLTSACQATPARSSAESRTQCQVGANYAT